MNETLAIQFLKIAQPDILASRVLYEKELYSQSFFYFQQAAEKANKAQGLFAKTITESDLKKKVLHKSLKIQKMEIDKLSKKLEEILGAFKQNPLLEKTSPFKDLNIKEQHKKVNAGSKSFDKLFTSDLLKISLKYLKEKLVELQELEAISLIMPKGFKEKFRQEIPRFAEGLDKMGKLSPEQKAEMNEDLQNDKLMDELEAGFSRGLQNIILQAKAYYTITLCSIITMQHSSSARYPENGNDPLKFYNKDYPIIKVQLEFLAFLEKAVQHLIIPEHSE